MRQQIFRWDAHKIMKNVRYKKAEPGPRANRGGTPLPSCPFAFPLCPLSLSHSLFCYLPRLLHNSCCCWQYLCSSSTNRTAHPTFLLPPPLPQPLGRSCARVCFCIFATFHSFCFVISTRKQQTREGNGKRNKLRAYAHDSVSEDTLEVRKVNELNIIWNSLYTFTDIFWPFYIVSLIFKLF